MYVCAHPVTDGRRYGDTVIQYAKCCQKKKNKGKWWTVKISCKWKKKKLAHMKRMERNRTTCVFMRASVAPALAAGPVQSTESPHTAVAVHIQ